jgi:hypothetical protein
MRVSVDRPPRANGAVLASLLGPGRVVRRRPADSYSTLAEALSDSDELKSLGEIMAPALGIEVHDDDEHMLDRDVEELSDTVQHSRPYRFAPDAVLHVPEGLMEATKNLLQARGMRSRAWK